MNTNPWCILSPPPWPYNSESPRAFLNKATSGPDALDAGRISIEAPTAQVAAECARVLERHLNEPNKPVVVPTLMTYEEYIEKARKTAMAKYGSLSTILLSNAAMIYMFIDAMLAAGVPTSIMQDVAGKVMDIIKPAEPVTETAKNDDHTKPA